MKDPKFDGEFFRKFDLVLNGLDNMSARKHVNRMCMAANVPVLESGTMGYNGQVQPIIKGITECYDCRPKPADQKTFAVCTIHARPTSLVHCVHYAKELYSAMFDAAPDSQQEGEMAFVKDIVGKCDDLADSCMEPLSATTILAGFAEQLLHLLFRKKIVDLLQTKTDWTIRPPAPLGEVSGHSRQLYSEWSQDATLDLGSKDIRDMDQCVAAFVSSFVSLTLRRHSSRGDSMAFRKEDDEMVFFVAAIANLRAHCFHIGTSDVESLRSLAGNIVPAIATSNAIIAASLAGHALSTLSNSLPKRNMMIYLRKAPLVRRRKLQTSGSRTVTTEELLLHSSEPMNPQPSCIVCSGSAADVSIVLNSERHTIRSFVERILKGHCSLVAPMLSCGSKLLYEEEEFEALANKPLCEFFSVREDGARRATFIASDLCQSLEWTVTVTHSEIFGEVSQFAVDGQVVGVDEKGE